jgi:hypothetical protein
MVQQNRNSPVKTKSRREDGALTLIELFPLLLAVSVFVISGLVLTKRYGDSGIVWIISAVLRAGSWFLYALIVSRLARKL